MFPHCKSTKAIIVKHAECMSPLVIVRLHQQPYTVILTTTCQLHGRLHGHITWLTALQDKLPTASCMVVFVQRCVKATKRLWLRTISAWLGKFPLPVVGIQCKCSHRNQGSLLVVMRHSVASKCPFCFQGHAASWSLHAGSFMHFLLFHTRRTHMYTHSEKLHCINNIIHASTRCSPCLCSLLASTYHLAIPTFATCSFLFEIFKSFFILLLTKPILKSSVIYYSIVVANMYATVF